MLSNRCPAKFERTRINQGADNHSVLWLLAWRMDPVKDLWSGPTKTVEVNVQTN